ncbi:MAG TPA: PIG-L family deacetylase, partial [Polyangiaceae bacterium]|nr:PIG-L family deacetylase [Polyangiaceae bacterium]
MRVDETCLDRLCGGDGLGADPPRWLVVAAHPDDETIGAAGRIVALAATCTVVHVTDGAPSDRRFFPAGATNLSRAAYARVRRDEALRALGTAGVDAARVLCLGMRDQEASFDMAGLTARLA